MDKFQKCPSCGEFEFFPYAQAQDKTPLACRKCGHFLEDADTDYTEPHIVPPAWLTPAQVEAVNKLYGRSPDGSSNRNEFFTRVQESGIGSDRYAGINWCGMFIGIEVDGYTHS